MVDETAVGGLPLREAQPGEKESRVHGETVTMRRTLLLDGPTVNKNLATHPQTCRHRDRFSSSLSAKVCTLRVSNLEVRCR